MKNCLVTNLKVTVNNPNLPILETMKQFTLDAIALSGNNVMTETQKYALNHFFYQVGAISNNELWQKVKHLFMPMICNDNAEKAYTDYVLDIVTAAAGSPTFVNHGLHYVDGTTPLPAAQQIYTDKFTGGTFDLTLFEATMKTSFVASGGVQFMFDSGSSDDRRAFGGINKAGSGQAYAAQVPGLTIYVPTSTLVYDIGCVSNFSDSMYAMIGCSNNEVSNITTDATATELEQRHSEQNYVNGYLRLNAGIDADMGLFMICDGMSKDESQIIINAIKGLKQAFNESNT